MVFSCNPQILLVLLMKLNSQNFVLNVNVWINFGIYIRKYPNINVKEDYVYFPNYEIFLL